MSKKIKFDPEQFETLCWHLNHGWTFFDPKVIPNRRINLDNRKKVHLIRVDDKGPVYNIAHFFAKKAEYKEGLGYIQPRENYFEEIDLDDLVERLQEAGLEGEALKLTMVNAKF